MYFQRRDSAEHQNGGIEPWSNVCVFSAETVRNIRTGVIEPWSNVCVFSAETVWNIRTGGIEPWSNVCIFNQKKCAEDRMEISYGIFFELVYTG